MPCKKTLVTETATKETTTTRHDGRPCVSTDTRMNGSGQSRKEATDRMEEVLHAKHKTRIGFWNVRTMYETGYPRDETLQSAHTWDKRMQMDGLRTYAYKYR